MSYTTIRHRAEVGKLGLAVVADSLTPPSGTGKVGELGLELGLAVVSDLIRSLLLTSERDLRSCSLFEESNSPS